MSSTEESPAQLAARRRRERREAKILEGGSARLNKLINVSRTPAACESSSPSPQAAPTTPAPFDLHEPSRASSASPSPLAVGERFLGGIPVQQEHLQAFFRQRTPEPESEPEQQTQHKAQQQAPDLDPAIKLINTVLDSFGSTRQSAETKAETEPLLEFSPSNLLTSLGLPRSLSALLMRKGKPSAAEKKGQKWIWKMLHLFFALVVGLYVVMRLGSSVAAYGNHPPPPPIAQSPFVIFLTGELLLGGTRVLMKGREGELNEPTTWLSCLQNLLRDGGIAVFVLGMGSWWYRGWQA